MDDSRLYHESLLLGSMKEIERGGKNYVRNCWLYRK